MEARRQTRLGVDSLSLPFLATREADKQVFQYLLQDTSPTGAGISIPSWALARERLNQGERISLHLPFRLHHKAMDQGEVRWAKWREDLDAQLCGVLLDREVPAYYPVELSLEHGAVTVDLQGFKSAGSLLFKVIKDSSLLKRGVIIYLNHLAPYFSRVSGVARKEFAALRDLLFNDVIAKTETQRAGLEGLLLELGGEGLLETTALDLEGLRQLVQSEIYLDLYLNALDSEMAAQHLNAIKTLEGRLYYNYNTVVMLYLKSLSEV